MFRSEIAIMDAEFTELVIIQVHSSGMLEQTHGT